MDLQNSEIKQKIQDIINESLSEDARSNYDGRSEFGIQRYVAGLISEGQKNPKLMSFLTNFQSRIARGGQEWMMFEEFGHGLSQFQTGNKQVKNVINQLNETLTKYSTQLDAFKIISNISDEYVRESVTDAYNEFLADPCQETKMNMLEAIDNVDNVNENLANQLRLIMTDMTTQPELFGGDAISVKQQAAIDRRLEEGRKQKMANDIFKKVERYLDERQKSESEKQIQMNETYSLQGIANHNGLNLYDNIKAVLATDARKNVALSNILEQYTNALAQGAYEERLYETLLQNTLKFKYLLPVEKLHKKINEAVEAKGEEITLTKLLEMMRDNSNSYIYVDLIQEDVARYVLNPCPENRVQLRNALMPYANDPYISEMFNIIYSDDHVAHNTLSEQAISIKEQIDLIRQDTTVSNIYTPVQYIRENESIFNVRGQYYVKKGNSLAALDKKYISRLDERFVQLCHLVNDPKVQILDDKIILSGSTQYATIYEGYVDIDGFRESAESLRNLQEMYTKYENYDTNFFVMCSCLLENFNNIAKIDWAKHVSLNRNPGISADLFKLEENVYMAIHDDGMLKHTFYRNVNPMFCRQTLNEHMGINVSSLFSDILPDQDKIILRLNETKNEYEKSIDEYEKMIEDLMDAKEEATTDELQKQIDATIEDTKKKLEDVKSEYKEWQKETDEMIKDSDDSKDEEENDPNVTKETSSEPLEIDDIEDVKAELGSPIHQDGVDAAQEGEEEAAAIADEIDDQNGEISDDEFSGMLAQDATNDTDTPTEDDDIVIDTDAIDNGEYDETEPDIEDKEEFAEINTGDENADVASDDDIYADDEESDEVVADVPAETASDDEDIIIDDGTDEEDEIEPADADMTSYDAETGEEIGDEATDIFGGSIEDPLGTDSQVDTDLYNPHTSTTEFNIVNVMFDGNVNDGTVMKSGEVMALKPMVRTDGSKYVQNITVKFYLNADNNPVLNSEEDMSNAMYQAIVDAIKQSPQFSDVCENGVDVTSVAPVGAENLADSGENWEEEYDDDSTPEDKGIFNVGGEDVNYGPEGGVEVPDEIDIDAIDNSADETPAVISPAATPAVPAVADEIDTEVIDNTPDDEVELEFDDDTEVPAETDDDFDFSDIFGDYDEEGSDEETPAVETPEMTTDPVDTYTDIDGTEIEKPAEVIGGEETPEKPEEETAEDDIIPESYGRKVTKEQMNENRKSILSVKAK